MVGDLTEKKPLLADYLLLLLLGAILGSNFMMTKISVLYLPPMFVVTFRLAVATALLLIIMKAAGLSFPTGRIWIPLIIAGIIGLTIPFSLLAWAQQKIDAGLAAILMATMPLFTLLLAQLFTKDEKPNRYSIGGFAIALFGVIVLFGFDKLASLADQSVRQYAVIGAAFCYGLNAIVTKKLIGMDWRQSTACLLVIGFVASIPLLIISDLSSLQAPAEAWAATIYTGIVPTAIGTIIIILIVRRTSASFLSQINFLVPLFGVAFAILFVNEALPANGALALLTILCGVALARRRPKRKFISINKGV